MKRFWIRHRTLVVKALLLVTLSALAQVFFDFAKGLLLDQAVLKAGRQFGWLSAALLVFLVLKAVLFYGYTKSFKYFTVNSIADMRQGIFTSLLGGGYPRFIRRKSGELLTLYTNHLDTIDNSYFVSFYGSFQIVTAILVSLGGLAVISWELALLAAAAIIPPVFAPRLLKKRLAASLTARLDVVKKSTGHFGQWMDAKDLIHNYQAESRFLKAFEDDTSDIQIKTEKYTRLAFLSHTSATLLSQLGLMALIAFSAYRVARGELGVGMFLTATALMQELQGQVIYQAGYLQQIMSSKVAADEVLVTIDETAEQAEIAVAAPVASIAFEHLHFRYDADRAILKDLNLSIDEKGIYLITGESGAGKSTAMNLLAGYYCPDDGAVTINGVDAHAIANLPEKITVMRQEASFFTDTLRNNLTMYRPGKDDDILNMMRRLGLEKYAAPESLDLIMSPEGEPFSGGEARRLSLVRCLQKPSDILILDEPLANVDEETIEKIIAVIGAIDDRYIFIITHQIPSELRRLARAVIDVGQS